MGKSRPDGKPKGKCSSYAFFVQTCREEHKKKHPGESVQFAEFSKKCAEKWKTMGPKEKKRFEDMAGKDKDRYDAEMEDYTPPDGEKGVKRKQKKDPNAPKRSLSAFFFFCNEERPSVRKEFPEYQVGDVAKVLGKKWGAVTDRKPYEVMAAKDKKRYEAAMAIYKGKKPKVEPKVVAKAPEPEDDDESGEEEEEEDDESGEEEEEDDE